MWNEQVQSAQKQQQLVYEEGTIDKRVQAVQLKLYPMINSTYKIQGNP